MKTALTIPRATAGNSGAMVIMVGTIVVVVIVDGPTKGGWICGPTKGGSMPVITPGPPVITPGPPVITPGPPVIPVGSVGPPAATKGPSMSTICRRLGKGPRIEVRSGS